MTTVRLLVIASVLVASTVLGQTRYFDLDKLDSPEFRDFIAGKKVVVIGEMHGTTEVPLFVLDLVKKFSEGNKEITVGLEIPSDYQGDIDEFLAKGDFTKLLKLDHFKYPDGRTSVAMGELIKGLRDVDGISVICFDIDTKLDSRMNRDSVMGVNLAGSYKGGQMIMLTGNLHANLKEGYWRPGFKSAVYHFRRIAQLDDKLISLNTLFGSGRIWNCMQDGCKERDAFSNAGVGREGGSAGFIGIYEGVHPSGYSGYLYLDKVTASRPMIN